MVIPGKWVSLREGEIGTVCANQRHQNGRADVAGHGEGMIRVSKSSYSMLS